MERTLRFATSWLLALIVVLPIVADAAPAQEEPPVDWIDAKTGHRVVRLSREPGNASLYFHQYPYSADGKKLVFSAPSGIWTVHLETRELDQVVEGRVQPLLTGLRRATSITSAGVAAVTAVTGSASKATFAATARKRSGHKC